MEKTPWFDRSTPPVRKGLYECYVRVPGGLVCEWPDKLKWDGVGFIVPMPMVVLQWRGLTKPPKGQER